MVTQTETIHMKPREDVGDHQVHMLGTGIILNPELPKKNSTDKVGMSDEELQEIVKSINTEDMADSISEAEDTKASPTSPIADPHLVPLPPATAVEEEELRESFSSENGPLVKEHHTQEHSTQKGSSSTAGSINSERKKDDLLSPAVNLKAVSRKKSFSVFGTLRKLSTTNLKPEKKPLTPTSATKPQSTSPVTPIEHIEVKKKTPPPTLNESKKSTSSLFRSIRAAIKLSSKSAPNSPTVSTSRMSRSPLSPISPVSPLIRRPTQKDALKSPIRQSSRLSHNPIAKRSSQRHSMRPQTAVRQSYQPPVVLRAASTWSPAPSNPVLISNPNAKLYTVWPRYPLIDAQIAEVQELLEGLLPNDKNAIETSREPGSVLVVHYWKAPLTAEQAEVVKSNKLVSSIQLSKLDYDMSDMF